jgi:hypothetical protein
VLGLRRAIREEAGIDVGDPVEVELERDDAPREVQLPSELAASAQMLRDGRRLS